MYLGRVYLGDEVPLGVQSLNGSGVQTEPSSAPTARVYDASGTLVLSQRIPLLDVPDVVGLFKYQLFLDSRFSAQSYDVVFRWTIGADTFQATSRFDVIAGGHVRGTVIAMYRYQRPEQQLIIEQASGGQLLARRNPR